MHGVYAVLVAYVCGLGQAVPVQGRDDAVADKGAQRRSGKAGHDLGEAARRRVPANDEFPQRQRRRFLANPEAHEASIFGGEVAGLDVGDFLVDTGSAPFS
jgi:hypothetical protein